jgi:hypothetical protein
MKSNLFFSITIISNDIPSVSGQTTVVVIGTIVVCVDPVETPEPVVPPTRS